MPNACALLATPAAPRSQTESLPLRGTSGFLPTVVVDAAVQNSQHRGVPMLATRGVAALLALLAQKSRRHRLLRALELPSRGPPRPASASLRATPTAVKEQSTDLCWQGNRCRLDVIPATSDVVASWLDGWMSSSDGSQETRFWRQRMIIVMKQRLQNASGHDRDGYGAAKHLPTASFEIYALRAEGAGHEEVPLALAFINARRFPLAPLQALHLEQFLRAPDAPGAGAVLLEALLRIAMQAGKLLTVDPQSEGLESYFSGVGFQRATELDPYLWFRAGESSLSMVELRYPLTDDEGYDRLLAAFKRPPAWVSLSEEAFFVAREDVTALDVLSVSTLRPKATSGLPRAFARRLHRRSPSDAYEVEIGEEIPLIEAMGVMRGPNMLSQVNWPVAESLGSSHSSHQRIFTGLGRCSITQRAYPLPGVPLAWGGAELVIESLELPMRSEVICSVVVICRLGVLSDVLETTRALFNTFKVRAVLHRNPTAWNVEVVQSNGLNAAMLQSQSPPLPGEEAVDQQKQIAGSDGSNIFD